MSDPPFEILHEKLPSGEFRFFVPGHTKLRWFVTDRGISHKGPDLVISIAEGERVSIQVTAVG